MTTTAIMNSSDRCYCQDSQHVAIPQAFWQHTFADPTTTEMGLGFFTGRCIICYLLSYRLQYPWKTRLADNWKSRIELWPTSLFQL